MQQTDHPRTWTLDIPAPAGWLNANKRSQHRYQTADRQAWYNTTLQYAAAAKLPRGLERVHITAILRFRTDHPRDPNNWNPTTKVCVDALVKYGLVRDDNANHVIGPDHRRGEKLPPLPPAKKRFAPVGHLILVIRQLEVR